MQPGFLGTRADLLMDIILIAVIAVPFVCLWSMHYAQRQNIKRHSLIQKLTFLVILIAVVLFEINVRISGGSGSLLKGSPWSGKFFLHMLLAVHITIAVSTYGTWGWMLWKAGREHQSGRLPGGFSKYHKQIGIGSFIG